MQKNNYSALVIVLVILAFGLFKKYGDFSKKIRTNDAVGYEIFSNASDLISPKFTHRDNETYRYYEDKKTRSFFRSFFFAPGVAVADLNQDGFEDFVVINSLAGALPQVYINNEGKGFIEETKNWVAPFSFTDAYDSSISPFFFDLDGDGDLDLFVTSIKCNKFFLNDSSKFVFQPDHPLSKDCQNSQSALPYDFNADGKLDLMVIRYTTKKWQEMLESQNEDNFIKENSELLQGINVRIQSNKGGFNTVYYNDMHSTIFDDQDSKWSFDARVTDLDNDGVDELFVANDFGDDRIFHFDASGFKDVSRKFMNLDRRNGMSITTNYLPNDPYPFVYISNIWMKDYIEKGNFYWHYKRGKLVDEAEKQNVDNCRWAWSSAIADFNLDGFNDIYGANGFISHESGNDREGNFKMASTSSLPGRDSVNKVPLSLSKVSLAVGAGKSCLKIYSPKEKKFVDTKIDKSFKIVTDTRAAATIDFDNDGDLDLLVTAQNGDMQLFKNNSQENKQHQNWIGFRIKNHHFIRKIILSQGEEKYYKDWQGGRSGFLTTSDSRIYFTMKNDSDVEVIFQFVDGRKVSKKFSAGKYYDLGVI